ncbi:MAG: hypothetical protein Q8N35_08095 [Methylococcaceae bacterium]|nr:hypothetical protein [Methylococcaceae bacterium]MDZ4154946.1 hypothetical protein [Methylococcales bacterium]MDP2392427.1 hypothetical protein [Methylococcaceae bacterium]MDP3019533.1 hypothetical protein [Methylococcaceae bacterium]MDP3389249.1 hypothetical protein [Methylococcaceae bacterium]
MKHYKKLFQLTATATLLGISGIGQAALTQTNTSTTFNLTKAQADTNLTTTATSSTNSTLSGTTPTLDQFNAATGVLTGVTLQLNSTRTATVSGTASKTMGPARTANFNATVPASGGSTFAASGITTQTFGTIAANTSCSLSMGMGSSCTPTTGTSGAQTTNTTAQSVAAGSLNNYVGSSNVSGINLGSNLSSNISGTSTLSAGSANAALTWTGSVTANYTYLLHADASFNGNSDLNSLTLDFGTVFQNSAATNLTFSIFNLADSNRISLDLDSVVGSGNTSVFNDGLASFLSLAQGSSNIFNASLLTSTVGTFSAQYLINLSDADIGASSTRQNQQLTLNLVGNVAAIDNVAAVPVPASICLFNSALLGLLGLARRKQIV